ncbi:D-2-hydroxyacid dehydrogenase [Motiliproteus sp. SC1-56]|uniref:D-2-hydroxyacid dehydrogenase n=1 Tax=Motiliproteus sp. SC1-56 TaxID=2799565 RepID=UPI001A8EF9FF|nr:D-2-hydroxyacid dehydrogenase [Motiliproteus sp. SC1-56]
MAEHLLILSKQAARYKALLTDALPEDLRVTTCTDPDQATAGPETFTLLLADPDLASQALPDLPCLRWLQSTWAGVRPLVERPERHYRLTNVKGVFGPLMSEYVFAHLLAHVRKLDAQRRAQASQRWQPVAPGTLRGKTMGLLGLGSIGQHLAGTAKQFGMRTLGCARTQRPLPQVDEHYTPDQLADMVSQADYFVASLPSTPATRGLLDRSVLEQFKPGALLINVGRGDLIDDAALIDSLNDGHLGGAVLDVFRQEPLPPEHPFWTTERVTLTAHTAAPSFPEDITPIFLENLARYRAGEPLMHEVDFDRGY